VVDLFSNFVSSTKISNFSVNHVKSESSFLSVDRPDLVRMVLGFLAKIDIGVI
jgi:hypothetical protein